MTTKAQDFRYFTERKGPKKPKAAARPRREEGGDASQQGAAAAERRGSGVKLRASKKAGKKAVFALETSAGKPSRKSTRGAANRQKTDAKMRVKRRVAESRPGSRPSA
jgi:hypothetical protein